MKITTIGLNIAKSVFQLLAMNPAGRVINKKKHCLSASIASVLYKKCWPG
jgi:hypothetical protein